MRGVRPPRHLRMEGWNPLKHFTIAIDGPGGAGKSSVANHVAGKLNVLHLDTGAMYRAFAYQALQDGLNTRDAQALAALANKVQIDVRFIEGMQRTLVNGQDVTERIRTPQISMATSDCATHSEVRKRMVAMQQRIAAEQSMVLDGRDIGTKVLPHATLKIFLTASPEVRAKRRYDELVQNGISADYQSVLSDVVIRDRQDSTREIDPLCPAVDATILDTSNMSQLEVEQTILSLLEKKMMQEEKGKTKPVREKLTPLYRIAQWLSVFLFHTLLPVRYHGLENVDLDAPYILIGNHNSGLDPLLIGWKVKRYQIRYLGKKELTKNPILKAMYKHLLMIPVDRHNMDMGAVRLCLKTLKEKHVLGIFPEGTRYKKSLMGEMESGVAVIALRGDVPILPAYISGKPKLFRLVHCYYGEPFSVSDIAKQGITKETCDEVLNKIIDRYQEMAQAHVVSL